MWGINNILERKIMLEKSKGDIGKSIFIMLTNSNITLCFWDKI